MIDYNILNLPAFVRHYMLANTPTYLYRRLRDEPSIEALAVSSTPAELLKEVSAREEKTDRTAEDVALAYAMLVALSFQDHRQVQQYLSGWHPRVLSWAQHIISILKLDVLGLRDNASSLI